MAKSNFGKLTLMTTENKSGYHCHGEILGEPKLIAESLFQSALKYPKMKTILFKAFELWITSPKEKRAAKPKPKAKKKTATRKTVRKSSKRIS